MTAESTDTQSADSRTTRATGTFTFENWEEHEVRGQAGAGGPRLARATVTNAFTGSMEAAGTACAYTIAYLTATTGTFVGHEMLTGSLDGRKGSFVLEERGTFGENGTVCTFEVVPGSGTGELAGLTGTGGFTHEHGMTSVPYTFEYRLG
ncbi:DUF3224 domain-containing protein [Streptomyces sp. MST-110588]|uniref:DUF3224 domain-containing protein n=1 Tax=Streptomyces sp. MST-110588 TaxID=2833628 RepID=UPI001F5C4B15|nr:DUF3224 domain-containing protein [Streptomyces sp. MST-110588]UNO39220.1 DUF3224 domain-containing protein [Streptomyces sp. MST-110588]